MKQLLWLALALPLVAAETPKVEMETNFGTLAIELCMDDAPNTVTNFLTLAEKGFYDGLKFHRIIKGFMAQGGDPAGDGSGGPTDKDGKRYCIPAEFNARKHVRGTLSMARTFEPNTAGSQFFLCFKEVSFLDDQYTVFGQVTGGDEVLAKIEADAASDRDGMPPRAEVKIVKAKVVSKPATLPVLVTLIEDEVPFLGVIPSMEDSGTRGLAVGQVHPEGGAAKSGVKGGDLIEKVGDKPVRGLLDYAKAIVGMKPGDKLVFTVRRGDEAVDVTVTAGKMK